MENYQDKTIPFNANITTSETKPMIFKGIHPAVSNDLIFGTQEMTIEERRLLTLILAQVDTTDQHYPYPTYTTTVKELAKVLNLKGKNSYNHVKNVVNNLSKREVIVLNDQGIPQQYPWFKDIRYESGYLMATPNPALLRDHVLGLKKHFAVMDLKILFNLTSIYALRLYEVLYARIGKIYRGKNRFDRGEMLEISLDKETLNRVLTANRSCYHTYDYFRRIIKPATEEISKNTDLSIEHIRQIHQGKNITAYTFEIRKRSCTGLEEKPLSQNGDPINPLPSPETRQEIENDRSWFSKKTPEAWRLDFLEHVYAQKRENKG